VAGLTDGNVRPASVSFPSTSRRGRAPAATSSRTLVRLLPEHRTSRWPSLRVVVPAHDASGMFVTARSPQASVSQQVFTHFIREETARWSAGAWMRNSAG
jgi:hypothetical protein